MVTLRRENACRFRLDDPDEFSLGDGVRALKASGTRPDDRATAITALKAPGRPHYASSTANTTLKAPGRSTGRASLRSSSLASLARAVLASSGPGRAAGPFHSRPEAGRAGVPGGWTGWGPWRLDGLGSLAAGRANDPLPLGKATRLPSRFARSLPAVAHSQIPRTSIRDTSFLGSRMRAPSAPPCRRENRVTPPRAPEPPRSLPGSGAPVRFPRRPRTPSRRTAPCCRCPRRPRPGPASARRTP